MAQEGTGQKFMRRLSSVLLLALLALTTRPAAQEPTVAPDVVFRAGTDLVRLAVTVLDGRRQPITGLTAADFTVLEDEQPREIATFAVVDLGNSVATADAAWMNEVPPDVVDNQDSRREGRLVVILMDRSIPVGHATVVAREAAIAAVEALGPNDMAALVSTSGRVPHNFTTDRARLIRAINQPDWSTGVSAEAQEIDARMLEEADPDGRLAGMAPLDGRCLCGLCVHETMTNVASALEDLPDRHKSILFIGSRFRLQGGPDEMPVDSVWSQPEARIGCAARLDDANKTLFTALDRSGVTVHTIDPVGLQTVGPTSRAASTERGFRVRRAFAESVDAQLQQQGELNVIPERTGGRAVANTNGPQDLVPAIIDESRSYYLLGFRPDEQANPARPRSIEVKVNRRGASVHTRREIVIEPAGAVTATATQPSLADSPALTGLLPDASLPMDVNVASFAVPGAARAAVTVAAGVQAFAPDAASSDRRVPVEIVAAAYDHAGRPQASARQSVEIEWPDASAGARLPERIDALSRLDLLPGDYEIRVAATAAGGAQTASVFTHITVPAFADARLSISHMVIEAARTARAVPPTFLDAVLPVTPTPQRQFSRTDSATVFVRLYQGANAELEDVPVRVRLVDRLDRDVRDEVVVLRADSFGADRSASLRMPLPLAQLSAGDYLLRLEAVAGEHMAGRAIRFSVR